jgi:2-succinyl-6-hydroxy-2,4-cyclohexadiene-1-carboxylate synthase
MQFNLLHGFTQTSESWAQPIAALKERLPAATFWAPDMPGHGNGMTLPYSITEGATAIAELASPGIWIGYSMGGRYLLHIATQHPEVVTALVLVSTTAGLDTSEEREERRNADHLLADSIERDGVSAFLQRWMALPLFSRLRPSVTDLTARHRNSSTGLAESLRHAGTGCQQPLWDELASVDVPTLVVTGSEDEKFCALGARLTKTMPQAKHVTMSEAGHAAHLENSKEFADHVVDWANSVSTRSPST